MTESESAHPSSQPEFVEFAPVDETELMQDSAERTPKAAESVINFACGTDDMIIRFDFVFSYFV